MTTNAVDLLIKSKPMWHQTHTNDVPVSVVEAYSVLGRRGTRWESILSTTDDVHIARRTMEAANSAGIFDRIVITKGRSVNNAPAGHWETVECALPQHRVITGDSFTTLLHKLQMQTANIDRENTIEHSTPIVSEKQPYTFSLLYSCILAGLNMNAAALVFVGWLCFFEIMFLMDKRPIRTTRLKKINLFRNWFYALFNGALLIPLVLKFFA